MQPTYEDLKQFVSDRSVADIRGLQPTYEDLKQYVKGSHVEIAGRFAAYLRGFETSRGSVPGSV